MVIQNDLLYCGDKEGRVKIYNIKTLVCIGDLLYSKELIRSPQLETLENTSNSGVKKICSQCKFIGENSKW